MITVVTNANMTMLISELYTVRIINAHIYLTLEFCRYIGIELLWILQTKYKAFDIICHRDYEQMKDRKVHIPWVLHDFVMYPPKIQPPVVLMMIRVGPLSSQCSWKELEVYPCSEAL